VFSPGLLAKMRPKNESIGEFPGEKRGMVIEPFIGNPYDGYINPYKKSDRLDEFIPFGNYLYGSLAPPTRTSSLMLWP